MSLRLALAGLGAAAVAVTPLALSAAHADAAPAVAAQPAPRPTQGLVGGRDATETYPWNATWGQFFHECGGTLVAPRWILTAKHCTVGSNLPKTTVRLGSKTFTSGGETVTADSWVKHPDLDLALMHLTSPASSKVAPIGATPDVDKQVRLLGWGAMSGSDHTSATTLQELDLKVVPDAQCSDGGIKGGQEFCVAKTDGSSGACLGDSGGPAVLKVNGTWNLVGVTSRGPSDCGDGGTIYSNVPAAAAWINQNAGTNIPVPAPQPTPTSTPTATPTPTSMPTPTSTPAPGEPVLAIGSSMSNMAVATRGAFTYVRIDVPAGTTSLTVSINGGTGDADLYVRAGAKPTTTTYDCRPYRVGNNESCSLRVRQGTYFVGLRAFAPFAGVTVSAR